MQAKLNYHGGGLLGHPLFAKCLSFGPESLSVGRKRVNFILHHRQNAAALTTDFHFVLFEIIRVTLQQERVQMFLALVPFYFCPLAFKRNVNSRIQKTPTVREGRYYLLFLPRHVVLRIFYDGYISAINSQHDRGSMQTDLQLIFNKC